MAVKVTIQNGQFQDAAGVAIVGTLVLQLSQDAVVSGTGQVAPKAISITVTAGQAAATPVWGNDNLTPSGTTYTARLFDTSGALVWGPENWSITGAGPIEINTLVPASGSVSYSGAVLLAPSGDQTITTNNVLPASGNTTQSLGASAAPWQKSYVNLKQANNVVFADQFSGATADVKIAAACAALAGAVGIVDARGLVGSQSLTSALTIPTGVHVLLGNATYTGSAGCSITMSSFSSLVGPSAGVRTVFIWPADSEGIITAAGASGNANVTLENLDLRVTYPGFSTASKALIHLKDAQRPVLRNVICSHESSTTAAAIRFEATTSNAAFGTWQGYLENVTIQRTTGHQGSASATGQIGLDLLGNSALTNGDVSMFTICDLWLENQTININLTNANNNRFVGFHTLLGGTNLVLGSSGTSGSVDNLFMGRMNQYVTQHFSIDSHSVDNVFISKLEGGTAFTDNGTRNTRFNSIGGTGNMWQVGAGNEFGVTDGGDGLGLRLMCSNDSTGFAGIGFRNNANGATNSQVYFQASDNSFHIYHNGSDRIVIPSGGSPLFSGAIEIAGATPTGTGTQLGVGNTTGFGNGAAGTAVTTTLKNTGTGPTTPQTIVKYLQIDIGGTKYYIPLVQ